MAHIVFTECLDVYVPGDHLYHVTQKKLDYLDMLTKVYFDGEPRYKIVETHEQEEAREQAAYIAENKDAWQVEKDALIARYKAGDQYAAREWELSAFADEPEFPYEKVLTEMEAEEKAKAEAEATGKDEQPPAEGAGKDKK
jgi:hypothetical protein